MEEAADRTPLPLQQSGYVWQVLPKVSRTFALTIPQLPGPLHLTVASAYLLCRVADTIEDEPALAPSIKRSLHDLLPRVIADESAAAEFAARTTSVLTEGTPPGERELVRSIPNVASLVRDFRSADQRAIADCLTKMCAGMKIYEGREELGLRDLSDLNHYCYYVAGVVGEMLTDLFCNHDPAIARRREDLLARAASFGQGLQMTNILKDVWDDLAEQRCWMPRSEFESVGYAFDRLDPCHDRASANRVVARLVAIAHGHLRNALEYTLCIPPHETGIRRFCFWSIGLALLTLQRIRMNPNYPAASAVKVPRTTLTTVIGTTYLVTRSNTGLKCLFGYWSRHLPLERRDHAVVNGTGLTAEHN